MLIYKEEISSKGRRIMVDAMRVENKVIIITGKLIKMARIKEEWFEDVEDPELLIKELRNAKAKPDIFTFGQKLPETEPKYHYYMEWDTVSALSVRSFNHWWEKQISSATRNKIRKAKKKGVVVKIVDFSNEFVKGIVDIFNEIPIRRGKPFWHYGKDFDAVKKAISRDLHRSDFIGAYYNDYLIGYIQLLYAGNFAEQIQNLTMIEYRNKYPSNALIAKAVEICEKKKITYLTYGSWRRGSHADFLRRNGFEKICLPRYYVPLTLKGKIILKLKLHRGIKGILPEKIITFLLYLRANWYTKKCAQRQ